jgi:hypothetical protein
MLVNQGHGGNSILKRIIEEKKGLPFSQSVAMLCIRKFLTGLTSLYSSHQFLMKKIYTSG